jgi:hypothetical protein
MANVDGSSKRTRVMVSTPIIVALMNLVKMKRVKVAFSSEQGLPGDRMESVMSA